MKSNCYILITILLHSNNIILFFRTLVRPSTYDIILNNIHHRKFKKYIFFLEIFGKNLANREQNQTYSLYKYKKYKYYTFADMLNNIFWLFPKTF